MIHHFKMWFLKEKSLEYEVQVGVKSAEGVSLHFLAGVPVESTGYRSKEVAQTASTTHPGIQGGQVKVRIFSLTSGGHASPLHTSGKHLKHRHR